MYREDSFDFMATPQVDQPDAEQEIHQVTETFHIDILLRNDNAPKRLVDKIFNVVANEGRPLTTSDLLYEDPDVDFDNSLLVYKWRGVRNGELVRSDNHSVALTQFTQKELEAGVPYFQHRGANYGQGW